MDSKKVGGGVDNLELYGNGLLFISISYEPGAGNPVSS